MRDYVKKLEIENYWSDEKPDPLKIKLDEIIKKGQYNVTITNK